MSSIPPLSSSTPLGSSSLPGGAAPSRWQVLNRDSLQSVFENLGKSDLDAVFRTCRQWRTDLLVVRETIFKKQLLFHLLPGIREDQLPRNLTRHVPDTKTVAWEETHKSISRVVYGFEFLSSIGVRTITPAGPIPPHLFEKKYLPIHSVTVRVNSTLALNSDGRLTNDPEQYAPDGHRHFLMFPVHADEGVRTLEFPNTQENRDLLNDQDFLAANPSLKVAPYEMKSPLEQGSPFLAFQSELEIDVPAGSTLRVDKGVLKEDAPNEMPARTVKFLNTPFNWLFLAQPILTNPNKNRSLVNPYKAKYLNGDAKPVKTVESLELLKEQQQQNPAPNGWIAPFSKLVALGDTYNQQAKEAEHLGLDPLIFQQDSIHRILTQIRGESDLYPDQHSRTLTELLVDKRLSFKTGTAIVSASVYPVEPALASLVCFADGNSVGLATAFSPASSLEDACSIDSLMKKL